MMPRPNVLTTEGRAWLWQELYTARCQLGYGQMTIKEPLGEITNCAMKAIRADAILYHDVPKLLAAVERLEATLAERDAALAAVTAERDEARAERRDLMATIEEVAPGVIVAFDADASAAVRDLVEAGDRLAEIVDDAMPYSVALAAWRALTRGGATDGR